MATKTTTIYFVLMGLAFNVSGALANSGESNTKVYNNGRFGYSIAYPSNLLTISHEATDGDGVAFNAKQGSAEMHVSGSFVTDTFNPNDYIKKTMQSVGCDAGTKPYNVAKPTMIAVSCIYQKTFVYYEKAIVYNGNMATVSLRFPKSEKPIWDPVIKQVANSFKSTAPSTASTEGAMSPNDNPHPELKDDTAWYFASPGLQKCVLASDVLPGVMNPADYVRYADSTGASIQRTDNGPDISILRDTTGRLATFSMIRGKQKCLIALTLIASHPSATP